MMLRTKGEQKAYMDGFEMCAECIEKYLTEENKRKLECLLLAVRNAVEIEDIEPQNYSIKTVTNAKEAENYPISEDISKGIEEINKLIFENGQAESEVQE